MLGGLFVTHLLPSYGWPAIFLTGAILGLVMLLVVALFLPEPIAPMIARPTAGTLARVNAYLARCGMAPIAELPAPPSGARSAPLKALFAPGMAGLTTLITCIYFLHVVTLFFMQSWAPSLIASEGFAPAKAASIALWLNVGGIVGGPLLGATSVRLGLKTLVMGAMSAGAVVTAIFGAIPPNFFFLALGSAAAGFCLQGAMMGLYAVVARTFPAHIRASGIGLVIGIGRIGSAVGPALAGLLMTMGLTRGSVAIAMAAPTLTAALLLLKFRVRGADMP
jgi:MFS transporter, AAHS family, 4-hydroxybenzoate transporter